MKELNYLAKIHEYLNQNNVMLAYDGVLSKDIVSAFLTRLRADIERIKNASKVEKKRFFSIAVECIQNLSKHGNVSDMNDGQFLVVVEREQNALKISTGNLISTAKKGTIENLINNVNSKSNTELTALYRKGIATNTLSVRGEANLGLIDIARKSANKLFYQFNEIDSDSTFFLFQTQMNIAN